MHGVVPSTASDRIALKARALNAGVATLVSNSPQLTEYQWRDIEFLLNKPLTGNEAITSTDFASLATLFGRLYYVPEIERFLNTLTQEVSLIGIPSNARTFTVCPVRITGIQLFLEIDILTTTARQIGLWSEGFPYYHLNAPRHRMMQNSALLTTILDLTPRTAMSLYPARELDHTDENLLRIFDIFLSGDNGLPFSLSGWDVDGGWVTLNAQTTQYVHGRPAALFRPNDVTVHFSEVLNGPSVSPKLRAVLGEEFSTRHQHNPADNIISALVSLGFDLATMGIPNVASALLDTGSAILGVAIDWGEGAAQAAAIQADFNVILGNWELSDFHQALGLDSVVIWQVGEDPQLISRISPDSLERLNKLNDFIPNNSSISQTDFMVNPVGSALDTFRGLTIAQRGDMNRYNPQQPQRHTPPDNIIDSSGAGIAP